MAAMTRAEVAEDTARRHFTVEPDLKKIIWVRAHGADDEPLRFLEVAVHRAGMERGIEVYGFDATKEVPYATEVAEVTERELTLVVAGVLSLPDGWGLDDVKAFTREGLAVPARENSAA